MHNAFGVRNIRQQFVRRNCFYRVLTLYLVSHDNPCKLSATLELPRNAGYISTHGKYSARRVSARRAKRATSNPICPTAARRAPFRANFRTCLLLPYQSRPYSFSPFASSPLSSPPLRRNARSVAGTAEFYVLRGRNARPRRRCVRIGDLNKGKICKMIRVANSIASELED